METATTQVPRRRRRLLAPKLGLRALMALVLVVGGGLGWVLYQARVQRDAVTAIERSGGSVVYDWQMASTPAGVRATPGVRPPWPKWLVDTVGVDLLHTVRRAHVPRDADAVLAAVARLEGLESLTVGEFQRPLVTDVGPIEARPILTDVGLERIRGLSRLTEVYVVGGAEVSKAGLENLTALPRLRTLVLNDIRSPDDDLAPVGRIQTLEVFRLNDFLSFTTRRRQPLTDDGLAHLKGLTGVKTLSLGYAQVTSAGLTHLAGMTGLQTLSLPGSRLADLTPLSPLTGLRVLLLDANPIDDDGLAPLATLPRLQELGLDETRITDDGLARLQSLPSLTAVSVTGTRVTADGRQTFRRARPGVRVTKSSTRPA